MNNNVWPYSLSISFEPIARKYVLNKRRPIRLKCVSVFSITSINQAVSYAKLCELRAWRLTVSLDEQRYYGLTSMATVKLKQLGQQFRHQTGLTLTQLVLASGQSSKRMKAGPTSRLTLTPMALSLGNCSQTGNMEQPAPGTCNQ